MKKINAFFICSILAALFFTACASKPKVLSSKSSKHITVQQTSEGVYIDVHKEKSEDITQVQLIDETNGNGATISMENETAVNFFWPFATSGETYTIHAYLTGKKAKSEETVTFKTDSVATCITNYDDAYLKTKLVLIATENQRVVKLNTSKEALLSVLGPTASLNAKITVDVFSGKHFNASTNDYERIGTFSKDILNLKDLDRLANGYDIISTAGDFGYTPADLNKKLSSKPTYFARACVSFNLTEDDSAAVKYTTKHIYTNDTIYTPIAETDVPKTPVSDNAK